MDISEVMTDHLGSLHLPWGNMLDIERPAIFADMYQVQTLSETTLLALYQRLATASCDDSSFSTVIELAGIAYDGTPALRIDAPHEQKHVLRRMVSEYFAAHLDKFVNASDLTPVSGSQKVLMFDILVAGEHIIRLV
jgi:hypothetical protein